MFEYSSLLRCEFVSLQFVTFCRYAAAELAGSRIRIISDQPQSWRGFGGSNCHRVFFSPGIPAAQNIYGTLRFSANFSARNLLVLLLHFTRQRIDASGNISSFFSTFLNHLFYLSSSKTNPPRSILWSCTRVSTSKAKHQTFNRFTPMLESKMQSILIPAEK